MISTNYPDKNHEVLVIKRDNEILLATPCGKEIATLTVCTMETEQLTTDGKYKTVPTNDFWVNFNPKKSTFPDCANVYL